MENEKIAMMLTDHENEIGSIKHRLTKAENTIEQIHELTTSVKLIAQKQDNVVEKLDSLTTTVTAINNEPKETYKNIRTTIITGIVSALVTAVAAFLISNMH